MMNIEVITLEKVLGETNSRFSHDSSRPIDGLALGAGLQLPAIEKQSNAACHDLAKGE